MLELPVETEVNRKIENEKIFGKAIPEYERRALYAKQVNELWWRNKLSEQNFALKHIRTINEIEVFEIKLNNRTFDKRFLHKIDRAIPYYILHVLSFNGRYQALVANKSLKDDNVCVKNYIRSGWLNSGELSFDFGEKSIERLYESLGKQIAAKSQKSPGILSNEGSDDFMQYFKKMRMQRSYKPTLIIATLQNGGQISIDEAADFFKNYYRDRMNNGLPIECGRCVYSNLDATQKDMENNLIKNPVAALCGSQFFTYDQNARIFSLAPGIYDELSVDDIDEVIKICREKLDNYFGER